MRPRISAKKVCSTTSKGKFTDYSTAKDKRYCMFMCARRATHYTVNGKPYVMFMGIKKYLDAASVQEYESHGCTVLYESVTL